MGAGVGRAEARRARKWVAATSVAALAASLLAACSSEADRIPSIGYAIDNTVTTYNGGTTAGSFTGAAQAFSRVLPGFTYTGPEGGPLSDTDIGTAALVPGGALTVAYRINAGAVWSDGTPMGCEDLVLAWAARSGRFTGAPAEGTDVGAPMFDAAITAGYADIEGIDCAAGAKDALVRFRQDRAYTEWRSLFGAGSLMPAHVAARIAGVPDIPAAVAAGDVDALGRIAQVWNTGWNLTPGAVDLENFPSAGPYRIESFTAEEGLVLVANDRWWGTPPATSRITVWPKGIDIAAKAESADVEVLDADGGTPSPAGFTDTAEPGWGIEQLVLSTSGVFADPAARRGFAACVPRDQLFADFGHPGYERAGGRGAGVVDSRITLPGTLVYPAVAATAAGRYRQADVAGATAQFASAGVVDPVVRVGYLGPDERRARVVEAIAAACSAAGVTVVDAGSDRFVPAALGAGEVDAILTGTAAQPGATGSSLADLARFALRTGQSTNVGRFSNGRVDQIVDQLAVDDSDATVLASGTEAETVLWDQMPTIPLYNAPRKLSVSSGMETVVFNPTAAGAGWNMDRWILLE